MSKNYVEKRLRVYEDGGLEVHCMIGNTDEVNVTVASTEKFMFKPPSNLMDYRAMISHGREEGWFDRQDIDIFDRVLEAL